MDNKKRLLILFFLSGATGLVYQVIWARMMGLVFGNTTYAVSTVLAGFMAGLALGSRYFGRFVDREDSDELGLYGKLAAGVGIYAFLSPFIFNLIKNIYSIVGGLEINAFSLLIIFVLGFTAVALPTFLMGGTLPALTKYFEKSEVNGSQFSFNVGILYSVNSWGAVFGAFISGYILIMLLSVRGTLYLAAGVNIIIALMVLMLNRRSPVGANPAKIERKRVKHRLSHKKEKKLIIWVMAFSGFSALAYEVLWMRVLSMVLGSSTYAFSVMLCAFLAGLALGASIFTWYSKRHSLEDIKRQITSLGYIQAAIGISVLLLIPLFGMLPMIFLNIFELTGNHFFLFQVFQFLLVFGIMLVPTTLFGAAFPLACSIYNEKEKFKTSRNAGTSVGNIYSADTLGAILGSVAAGFALIPLLGIQRAIIIVAIINTILALVVFKIGLENKKWQRMLLTCTLVFFVIPYAIAVPEWNKEILSSGVYNYAPTYVQGLSVNPEVREEIWDKITGSKEILFYNEGAHFTVGVEKNRFTGDISLTIDGKTDASTDLEVDMITQIMSAHLPVFFQEEPKKALLVGLASGVTAGSLTLWPQLNQIDVVEIEPAMIEASSYFNEWNRKPLEDSRVRIIKNDARNFMLGSKEKYNVIISVPSNPWMSGSAALSTREYFKLARKSLSQDGVFCVFLQSYRISPDSYKTIVKTLDEVFEHINIWQAAPNDTLILASEKEVEINYYEVEKKFKQVENDFKRINMTHPMDFLAKFRMGREGIDGLLKSHARINTDNRPVIEFKAARNLYDSGLTKQSNSLIQKHTERVSKYMKGFEYHYELAAAYLNQGIIEEAKKELKLSIEQNFRLRESKNLLGYIYLQEGNVAEARKMLMEVIDEFPDFSMAYINLSHAYNLSGDIDKAMGFLENAIAVEPENAVAYNNMGNIYNKKGEYGKANEYFKKAIELNPEFAMAYINIGVNHLDIENNSGSAVRKLLKASELAPDSALAQYHLGRAYLAQNRIQSARYSFNRAMELDEAYVDIVFPGLRSEKQ